VLSFNSSAVTAKIKLTNEEVREATLNWGNIKLLVNAFGDDTDTWIDKEVRAWKTKSEKAKTGFVFVFVPTDWTRNDMGVWEDAEGNEINVEEVKTAPSGTERDEDDADDIDPKDIPFD